MKKRKKKTTQMILDISGAIYGATLFLDFFTQYPTVKKKKKKRAAKQNFPRTPFIDSTQQNYLRRYFTVIKR